jgi:hypothetical protein
VTTFLLIRRGLAIGEIVVFVLPLLALWPMAATVAVVEGLSNPSRVLANWMPLLVGGPALIAMTLLLSRFAFSGGEGLRSASRSWWWLSAIGAALVLVASAEAFLERTGTVASGDSSGLAMNLVGAPVLIPLVHMLIEVRLAANKQLQPSGSADG